MARNVDWLKRSHEGLYDQQNITVNFLMTPGTMDRLGISGAAKVWFDNDFIIKRDKFIVAFEAWRNPSERTPAKTAALLEAEKDFIKVYRLLYTGYLKKNPLVTDEDLVSMGLPKHPSGTKTPPTPPTTVPEATVDTSIPATVNINYRDKNEKGIGKPTGVHGVEIRWAILNTHPSDWDELTNSSFDTKTPATLVFKGEQRGKTLYFALRWENNVGQKGPWSDIYSAIIP
ncbi:MAG: hypothetical protein LBG80_04905 [Bacteroidales bacterium]|jgi:hypothetical protein|nr:hypothetical protein [Bacteroidales bacterium]